MPSDTVSRITRTGHKKSRHGCLRCKSRHVKCDEQRPCRNCTRHNVECSLVRNTRTKLPTAISATNLTPLSAPSCATENDVPASSTTLDHSQRPASSSSSLSKAALIKKLAVELEIELESQAREQNSASTADKAHPSLEKTSVVSPDWMKSLQLFNHYCVSTCLTLHHDDATLNLWRTVVPGLAVSHELLMHGLLALSALHYAHLHLEERKSYIMVSNYHQDRALDFFSTMLTDISEQNCEAFLILAIFIFLLAAWSVANPEEHGESITLGSVTQSFALIQGIKDIIEYPIGKKWSESSLSPLFDQWETAPIDPSLPFAKRLARIYALLQYIEDDDICSRDLCRAGFESLSKAYAFHRSEYSGRHRMWMWPVEIGKQRFDFTKCQHPVGLVILAHCAALIKCSEGPSWLWNGWGENVVHMIEREVDQEWQEWLQWPLRCIHDGVDVDAMES